MSRRSFRGLGFRLAGLALGAGCALVLPASNAHANAPPGRYTIAGGTVKDNLTGLTWQQSVDANSYTWSAARTYCSGLTLAGGGWRVPSVKELMTLVDFSVASPGPTIDTTAFPNTPATFFWSSSPLAGNPSFAWYVSFIYGSTYYYNAANTYRVRCVR